MEEREDSLRKWLWSWDQSRGRRMWKGRGQEEHWVNTCSVWKFALLTDPGARAERIKWDIWEWGTILRWILAELSFKAMRRPWGVCSMMRCAHQKGLQPNQRRADLNKHFSKEDTQMAKNIWKDVQQHWLLEKCKSKPRWGTYHLTPARMAIIKKSTNNKWWRGCGEKGTLWHCWCDCQLVQPMWKAVWRFLRKLNIELPCDPAIPLLGIYQDKTFIQKDTCTPYVHSSTIHNSQDTETI